MAASDAEQNGVRSAALEAGVMLASGDRNGARAHGEPADRGLTPLAPSSVSAPAGAAGRPEEVTVCEVCGLVSRLPRSPVCPACGAGHG